MVQEDGFKPVAKNRSLPISTLPLWGVFLPWDKVNGEEGVGHTRVE